MGRINPKVDFAFKKLFGSEENKDLLISLVNAVVSEADQIADLTLLNPYNFAQYMKDKNTILDIKAKTLRGKWINVEMQINFDLDFDRRALYYWSKLFSSQLNEGQSYSRLEKTISINFLDFEYWNFDDYHSVFEIFNRDRDKGRINRRNKECFADLFEMHFIELPKFQKDYQELRTGLDRWITFLNRAYELEKSRMPKTLRNPEVIKAIEISERMFDIKEHEQYEEKMKFIRDVNSQIASAKKLGLEEGLKEGLKEGRAEGKAEGLKEGLKEGLREELREELREGLREGELKTKQNVARNMKEAGIELSQIETITGLSIEDIRKL